MQQCSCTYLFFQQYINWFFIGYFHINNYTVTLLLCSYLCATLEIWPGTQPSNTGIIVNDKITELCANTLLKHCSPHHKHDPPGRYSVTFVARFYLFEGNCFKWAGFYPPLDPLMSTVISVHCKKSIKLKVCLTAIFSALQILKYCIYKLELCSWDSTVESGIAVVHRKIHFFHFHMLVTCFLW